MNADRTSQPANRRFPFIVVVGLGLACAVFYFWSCYAEEKKQRDALAAKQQQNDHLVQELVSSEELLLELTPRLRPLSRSVMNLRLPDSSARDLFADQVDLSNELVLADQTSGDLSAEAISRVWRVDDRSSKVTNQVLELWKPLFSEAKYFDNAKFYFVRGSFETDAHDRFNTIVGFNGLATYNTGRQASLHAELEVQWTRIAATDDSAGWEISSWKLVDITSMETAKMLFRNVLNSVLESQDSVKRAIDSKHTELTSQLLAGKDYFFPPGEVYPMFFPDVTVEHPGIAVVDIDDDGFDDLYVAMQHDENLLFRNKGDGTFEEVAAQFGLNIVGGSTSAIFADFDNDGDPDLFLGRARRPSLYLVNQKGRFVDQTTQLTGGELPALVSSMSAADYNNDGLLDIYICTYSPIEESNRFQVANKPLWIDLFLTPLQGAEVTRRNRSSHPFMDRAGPPNLLLQNVGNGMFKIAPENKQLELWRMTFQASWNDFDRDGDQDIYVSNDYAPDNFFRNDGPDGFTDITKESGLTGMGFGMGASWGDYDNDGQEDIYVSNMYSKAGQRITGQVANIDPRIREMAQGNFLYRLNDGKFSLVSGSGESDMKVAKSGWSWGGQFFDFDNDGFRDIYATSGYYTAPGDVAIDLDL